MRTLEIPKRTDFVQCFSLGSPWYSLVIWQDRFFVLSSKVKSQKISDGKCHEKVLLSAHLTYIRLGNTRDFSATLVKWLRWNESHSVYQNIEEEWMKF